MRAMGWVAPWAISFLVPATAAADDEAEARAKELFERYWELAVQQRRSLAGSADPRLKLSKLTVLRQLGTVDACKSREALLEVIERSRSNDEKVVGILSLGPIADVAAARSVVKQLKRDPDPVLAQALADGFARCRNEEVKAWFAGKALRTKQLIVLHACIEALGFMKVPEASPRLAALYAKYEKSRRGLDVATAAVHALGRLDTQEARPVLFAAAEHRDWRLRLAAADVIALLEPRDEHVLAVLHALLQDPSAIVRRTVAGTCGKNKVEAVVPRLIELLEKDPRLTVRYAAWIALQKISGRSLPYDVGAWRRWWKSKSQELEPVVSRVSFPRYYGFPVYSKRPIFVVDVTGSMSWPRQTRRIDVARRELVQALKRLRKGTSFNIVAYSSLSLHSWKTSEVSATPKNVKEAVSWVEGLSAGGATPAYDGLRVAFEQNQHFDVMYFLSDGSPNWGDYISREGIIASVKVMNRHRRAVVHTIALTLEDLAGRYDELTSEEFTEMKAFMKDLAASTGGECRIVVRPPVRK